MWQSAHPGESPPDGKLMIAKTSSNASAKAIAGLKSKDAKNVQDAIIALIPARPDCKRPRRSVGQ
jgi:hypothetical protein